MNKTFSFYSERANADLNDLNINGIYVCTGSCTNAPTSGCAWFVFVFGNDNNYFIQIAHRIWGTNETLKYRSCNNGSFDSWRSV